LRGRQALSALGLTLQHFRASLDLIRSLLGRSALGARLCELRIRSRLVCACSCLIVLAVTLRGVRKAQIAPRAIELVRSVLPRARFLGFLDQGLGAGDFGSGLLGCATRT
jgi:hypothetical protein